ncbi:hypothetical protein SDC9_82013 [bioreactor metagenome]|uniref:Uncharacterized protein n=1 Tax=bioreactor metagenome TaxID=1076179 RepID=A0A644Z5Y8_9ZZZZ
METISVRQETEGEKIIFPGLVLKNNNVNVDGSMKWVC